MNKNHQKRIEKISQAIYLVSNHIKDSDPLKWELRKESIGFLSCLRSVSGSDEMGDLLPDLAVETLATYARNLVSLLDLATVTGLISRNNGLLITQEIQHLLAVFEESVSEGIARAGYILSHDFFANDPELRQHLGSESQKGQTNFLSDKSSKLPNKSNNKILFSKNDPKTQVARIQKTAGDVGESSEIIKDKKSVRQTKIITLLRAQSNLSIKDFASVIPDCSEKTIQRELLELVEKGVIRKEGERRWSTYSLVS